MRKARLRPDALEEPASAMLVDPDMDTAQHHSEAIQLSQAISLKRIADLLDGGFFIEECNSGYRIAPPLKTKGEGR